MKIELVTPDAASAMLKRNSGNRPISKTVLDQYTKAILRGEWKVNGESIKLSASGRLLDGQHRLMAVARSGIPIHTYVARDIPEDVFGTLDQGKKRQGHDLLALKGEKYTAVMAAAIRWYCHISGICQRQFVTPELLFSTLNDRPHIRWWTEEFIRNKCTFMPSLFVAVLSSAADRHEQEFLHKFLLEVATGANLAERSPALVLRNRFLEKRVRGSIISQMAQVAYCIKATNAYIQGKEVSFLRFSQEEEMPQLL